MGFFILHYSYLVSLNGQEGNGFWQPRAALLQEHIIIDCETSHSREIMHVVVSVRPFQDNSREGSTECYHLKFIIYQQLRGQPPNMATILYLLQHLQVRICQMLRYNIRLLMDLSILCYQLFGKRVNLGRKPYFLEYFLKISTWGYPLKPF